MIEDRLAERLKAAVAAEPPLGFDPFEVVTEAVRRRKRRQAAGATALVTGGVALAAVAVFATSGTARVPVGTNPSGSSVVETTTPDKKNQPTDPQTQPSFPGSAEAVVQLGQVIPEVLRDQAPGFAFDQPAGGALQVSVNPRAIGCAYPATGTTHRYVSVTVSHEHDQLDLVGDPAAGGNWGPLVSDTPQQDGSHIRVYDYDDGDGTLALTVVHLRVDGVIVLASTTAKPEPGQNGLAVNQDVQTAIATDPRLTF
jgi:hypothetical protein